MDKKKKRKGILYLIIGLVLIFMTISLGVPASVVLYAKSRVGNHLGKPVALSDFVINNSGNVCIGFKAKNSMLNLMTYYYAIPGDTIYMRPNGSEIMINVSD